RIRFDGEVAFAALALAGLGRVDGVVLDSLGTAPVAGASVTFASESRFAAGARSRITDASGRFSFADVPLAAFSLGVRTNLQEPQLGGAASGALLAAGDLVVFEDGDADLSHQAIRLQPAGAIEGRVLLADGSTLAEGAVALLEQQPAGLRLSRVASATGELLFEGIPLGSYRLSVREPVTNGVALRLVALTVNGEVANLGDLVLDAEGPSVVSTEPAVSASGVSPSGEIVVRFDEPVAAASVTAQTFSVRAGGAVVPGARTLRDGGNAIAFVPAAPLPDLQNVDVTVRADRFGFENEVLEAGVRDLAGLSLAGDFEFGFTTGDTLPPQLVAVSPASGASEIHLDSVVRFEFSEPIARGSVVSASLTRSSGGAVAGRLGDATILDGRVLVFTPDAPLAVNETYTAVLEGPVRDLAGNAMPEASLTTTFATVDTRPPALASLALGAGSALVTGRSVVFVATLVGDEPGVRVEFSLGGALLGVAAGPPFTQSLLLAPALGTAASIRAVALDAAGNRSPPRDLALAIVPNQPPQVALVRPASGPVSQGDTVTVEVSASDDVALAELRFVASDGAVASGASAAAGESAVRTFSFRVPESAPVGSVIAVRAAATDALGVAGQSDVALLEVGDRLPPAITIGSPLPGASFVPGGTVTVLVRGDDSGGVATLRLTADGLGFDETRSFAPPAGAAQASFMVAVPSDAPAGSVNLVARAVDAAGNEASRIGVIRVSDVRAPAVRLATGSGSLLIEPGAAVAIDVSADDDVGVVRIELAAQGQPAQTRTIPATREARERFTLAVPETLALGATLDVGTAAFDAEGNAGTAAPLTLTAADLSPPLVTIAEPAEGGLVRPGETFDVHVVGSDRTGVAALALTATGAATTSETRPFDPPDPQVDERFAVAVPADASAGAPVSLAVVATDAGGRQTVRTRTLHVADIVRPAVVAVDPPSGASGVDPSVVVRVTFDEPVARSSVTGETISLACGQGEVAATRAFASADALVVLTPLAPLPAGDLCTVAISTGVRDVAGNALAAPVVASFSVRRPDTTPPAVVSVDPAAGATEVPLGAVVRIRFSEAIAPASVTLESVDLEAAGEAVAATRVLEEGGTVVAVTPAAPLSPRTAYLVRIGTSITDLAGNALAAPVASGFATEGPDLVGPRLLELLPVDGAAAVSVRPLVRACFDDAIDPASLGTGDTAALRVLDVTAGRAPVAGALAASEDTRCVVLTLGSPLGFERSYAAELRGALRGADGNPVTSETGEPFETRTHSFVTGRFAITQPTADAAVVEEREVTLEASGSAALGIARVVFAVNGEALPAITAAPFRATLVAPRAADTPTLAITATALDAAGAELASDAVTVRVVVGLRFEHPITGVPLGETGALRLVASSPPGADVAITLGVHDPSIVGLPASMLFPAGASTVAIPAGGLAEGATAVVATSSQGSASAIAAVSARFEIAPGTAVLAAPEGVLVQHFPSVGAVILPAGEARTVRLRLVDAPAASTLPVAVASSNPSVAAIGASVVLAAGETSALVTLVAGAPGEAVLTLRFGGEGRELHVVVG
ncbi:MAG: Ig-like domain-containing protein, partial [Deltaproteobacteria bacterium]|nr:Ig-like domain-containing protein [Deltaproteobacteria bacterium]